MYEAKRDFYTTVANDRRQRDMLGLPAVTN